MKYSNNLLNKLGSGATFKELSSTNLFGVEIPLAPLPEQQRIVKILDEVFEGIETAKKNAEKNLKNSRELFESYLQSIFLSRSQDWEVKNLGDVLEKIVGGGTPSKNNPTYWGGDIPWASVKDIKEGESILLRTRDFITKKGLENSAANLVPIGSLIISTRMGLGRVVRTSISTAINQDLKALFPKKELDSGYLLLFLQSKIKEIIAKGSGATVAGIRLEDLKAIEIPLPPLLDPKVIVKKLDEFSAQTKKLEAIYKQKLASLDELKKSVLKKAFAGEL